MNLTSTAASAAVTAVAYTYFSK